MLLADELGGLIAAREDGFTQLKQNISEAKKLTVDLPSEIKHE